MLNALFRFWSALGLFASSATSAAAVPFHYPVAEHGDGTLRLIKGVPVLTVGGTPEQIGEEVGVLALKPAGKLMDYPRDVFRRHLPVPGLEARVWKTFSKKAAALLKNFPEHHRRELLALAKASGVDADRLAAANAMFDLKNIPPGHLLGCSSLIIPPNGSTTGGLLFGRNLDFFDLGYLHKYSLLTVYRPSRVGTHAFVSAGFPGFVGVFTGMNDAGLTFASHEVFSPTSKRKFNPDGVPFAIAYRRILEECDTVAGAVTLLKSIERTTATSLVIADTEGGAVIEVTPDAVEVRRFGDEAFPGVCTNHFLSDGFKNSRQHDTFETLTRHAKLTRSIGGSGKVSVDGVRQRLHAVNQGDLTIQTLVFEPKERSVHLRFGEGPVSGEKLITLTPADLWGP